MPEETDQLKYVFEFIIPEGVTIEHLENKVRFKGTKVDIAAFASQFHKMKELKDDDLCRLDEYVLKVSNYITDDGLRKNWIELPNRAWNIMGCKFMDVVSEYEDNPFDFNDCGYTGKLPFDIGVEVMDLPIRYIEIFDDGTHEVRIVER